MYRLSLVFFDPVYDPVVTDHKHLSPAYDIGFLPLKSDAEFVVLTSSRNCYLHFRDFPGTPIKLFQSERGYVKLEKLQSV